MEKIAGLLPTMDNFLIISHVSADGDTLGSGVALSLALKKLGKQCINGLDGKTPDKYDMIGAKAEFVSPEAAITREYGCIVAVDCGDLTRLGAFQELFLKHPCTVNIDHHGTNEGYAKYNFVRSCGATGQLVLRLIEKMGVELDNDMADALYVALSTDTGNFTYSNTDGSVLADAAKLKDAGAQIAKLSERIYRRRTLGATRLIGLACNRIQLYDQGKIGMTYVLLEDYKKTGAIKEDCDELINYVREIDTVEIAFFLRQVSGEEFKVSLRSCEYADVSQIACALSGGGHKRAAGGKVLTSSLEEAKETVLKAARERL